MAKVIQRIMSLLFNSMIALILRNLSGIKLGSIFLLFLLKNRLISHFGLESPNLMKRINISMLIGVNGLMKMKKKNKEIRDLEVWIPQ